MLARMSRLVRRLLIVALVVGFLYVAGGQLRASLGIDFDVESVRRFAQGLGPTAPLLFVLVVAGRSLLWLPSQVVLIAAGLCFGTLVGTFVGGAGLMLSGLALFAGARYAGRDAIEERFGARVRPLLAFTERRSGAVAFGLACGYPVSPLSPLQAAAGCTAMPVPNFVVAAFLGGLIRAGVFAYFGHALAQTSAAALAAPLLVFGAMSAVPLAFPSGRRWLRGLFAKPGEPKTERPER